MALSQSFGGMDVPCEGTFFFSIAYTSNAGVFHVVFICVPSINPSSTSFLNVFSSCTTFSCSYSRNSSIISSASVADTITALEFDDTGDYLATGDHGGRVVLFRSSTAGVDYASSTRKAKKNLTRSDILRHKNGKSSSELDGESEAGGRKDSESAQDEGTQEKEEADGSGEKTKSKKASEVLLWTPCHQFQSHLAEFDYLKSLEIEAKVNQLRFVPSGKCQHMMLLSTNDKTIKLWKVSAASSYTADAVQSYNKNKNNIECGDGCSWLKLPKKTSSSSATGPLNAKMKRCYNNAHSYHVNTLTVNSDGDSFASADDLRINIWNLEDNKKCMNVIDCKPADMEDLSEVITCAAFHPLQNHTLAFSTSKGCIKVADLRISALCDSYLTFSDVAAAEHEETSIDASGGVFRELMRSISDLKFSADGRYMSTRDYLNVKIWDLHMTERPISTIPIHPHLNPLLPQLYESESIFDKFLLNFCPTGKRVVTGSYNNRFNVREVDSGKPLLEGELPNYIDSKQFSGSLRSIPEKDVSTYSIIGKNEDVRTDQRVVHAAWHPHGNMLAIAGVAGLHLYAL